MKSRHRHVSRRIDSSASPARPGGSTPPPDASGRTSPPPSIADKNVYHPLTMFRGRGAASIARERFK